MFMARGNEDFRNKDFVVLELLADDAHAGKQTFFEDILRGDAGVESLLNLLLHDGGSALLQIFADFIQNRHGLNPP
jgi:hypothetical protein